MDRSTPRRWWTSSTAEEKGVAAAIVAAIVALLFAIVVGALRPTYFLYLFGLGAMFALLSLGLNVQWGFTGLINFSVAAFFGLGAYGAALMTASNSPIAGDVSPVFGFVLGLALAGVVAVLIGIPTLRLRADYLAIATLGLAEVVRSIIRIEREWTGGSIGLRGIPRFFHDWPVIGTLPDELPTVTVIILPGEEIEFATSFWRELLNVVLVLVFLFAVYLVLRRAHRSPWGRVLRSIRSDEDLAKALGKDTYSFKMQAFVLGSLVMALGGIFFAHLQLHVEPGQLSPDWTFLVWLAVILGGSGSVRGAIFGGFAIVTIREGTRFANDIIDWVPYLELTVDPAPLRLLLIGLVIVLVMRFRPQGLLPPQRELIWPDAVGHEAPTGPERAVREAGQHSPAFDRRL
ncbi:MAG: branched-chain amino acid ABC transporter permease, partial [Halobacteriota archaeon]